MEEGKDLALVSLASVHPAYQLLKVLLLHFSLLVQSFSQLHFVLLFYLSKPETRLLKLGFPQSLFGLPLFVV